MTEIDSAAAGTPSPIHRARANAATMASRRLGKAYMASMARTRTRSSLRPV